MPTYNSVYRCATALSPLYACGHIQDLPFMFRERFCSDGNGALSGEPTAPTPGVKDVQRLCAFLVMGRRNSRKLVVF